MSKRYSPVDEKSSKPAFVKLTPSMTRKEKVLSLCRALEKSGITIQGAVRPMRTGLSIGRVIPGLCRKLTPFGQRCGAVLFKCFSAG